MSARRRLFSVVVALGLVAAACSSSDGEKEPTSAGGEEQPVRGGTFVVGLASLPNIGLLSAVNTQGGMQQVAGLLYSGLAEIDEAGKLVPELATSWEIRDNGKVYEFTLRDGVKWHDFATSGKYVTAADVKFSFEVLLRNHGRASTSIAPALEQPCSTGAAPLNCPSITATEASGGSPAKVTFRFSNPYAPLLQQLLHTDGPIIPKHVWDGKPPPTAATPFPEGQNPVGTGPFKFESQGANEIVFTRNPDYFKPGLPYLDRVVWRVTAAPRQDLETGAIDWIWGVSGTDLPALRENPKIAIDTGTVSAGGSTNCTVKLLLNQWKEGEQPAAIRDGSAVPHRMLADLNVRRAIAMALNRSTYIKDVQQDDGSRLANGPINSGITWAFAPAPLPSYDLREADRLLTAAGWARQGGSGTRAYQGGDAGQPGKPQAGDKFEIDISGFVGNQTDLANKIKQDLAVVGIEVTANTVTPAQMNALYANRNYDVLIFSNCQGTDPEIGVRRLYHSTAITGAPFTNGAGYKNATVDGLFDQASQKVNLADRTPIYAQISAQIAKDLPDIYLIESVANRAYLASCKGFQAYTGHFAETGWCRR